MRIIALFAYILSQSSNLLACDFKLMGFAKLPDTPVLVKISDGKQEKFVADDDGFLIISMAAAECRSVHPLPVIKLTDTMTKCISDYYRKNDTKPKDQLNFTIDLEEDRTKIKTLAGIEKDCDVNQQRLWDKAYYFYRQAPMTCGQQMKSVVVAAVIQSVQFYYDTLTKLKQGKLTGSIEDQAKYVDEVRAARDYTQQFLKLIESNKTTVSDFEKWLAGLELRAVEKGYNVITKIDETHGAKNFYSLIDILNDMNSLFSFVKKQIACSEPFEKGTIASLVGVAWPILGAAPVVEGKALPKATK